MQGIEILVHVLVTVLHAQTAEMTQRAARVLAPVGSVHGDRRGDSILTAIRLRVAGPPQCEPKAPAKPRRRAGERRTENGRCPMACIREK